MKFRIEQGNATIPIDELNRLNDLSDELQEKEENLIVFEKEIFEDIQEAITKDFFLIKQYKVNEDKDEWIYSTRSTKTLIDLANENEKELKRLKRMSIKEFKLWKKQ